MARQEEDKAMEGLLRRNLAQRSAELPCPEAEILAAYMDRTLAAEETSRYELHFSKCTQCREQLGAMVRMGEAESAGGAHGSAPAKVAPFRAWALGWHWLAPAAVLLSFALVWFIRYRVQTRNATHMWTKGLVAMNRPQQPPAATPAAPPPVELRNAPSSYAPPLALEQASPAVKTPPPKISRGADSLVAKEKKEPAEMLDGVERRSPAGAVGGNAGAPVLGMVRGQAAEEAQSHQTTNLKLMSQPPPSKAAPAPAPKVAVAAETAKTVSAAAPPPPPVGTPFGAGGTAGGVVTGQSTAQTVEVTSAAPVVAENMASGSGAGNGVAGDKSAAAQNGNIGATQDSAALSVIDNEASNENFKKLDKAERKAATHADDKSPNLINGLPTRDAQGIAVIPTPDGSVAWRILAQGLVERSTDSGATWQGMQISADAQLLAGSAPTADVCWLVGRNGWIFMTRDSKNWTRIRPPAKLDFVGVTATDATTAVVTTSDGRKYATSNGGKKWQLVQ